MNKNSTLTKTWKNLDFSRFFPIFRIFGILGYLQPKTPEKSDVSVQPFPVRSNSPNRVGGSTRPDVINCLVKVYSALLYKTVFKVCMYVCMYVCVFYQLIKTIYRTWINKQYLQWYVINKMSCNLRKRLSSVGPKVEKNKSTTICIYLQLTINS